MKRRIQRILSELGFFGVLAISVIGIFVLIAIFAPIIAPHDPRIGSVLQKLQSPSPEYILGTDEAGRDIFSRLVWGARSALTGSFVVVLLAAIAATILAFTAAWFGGIVDNLISRVMDVLFAFPNMLLAMLAIALFGSSQWIAAIALAIAYTPYSMRVIRSVAIRERRLPYVAASRLQGIRGNVVVVRHMLPNVYPHIINGMTINFGFAMMELSALSFLGMGVQLPNADWGLMASSGKQSLINGSPMESLAAGTCIVVIVVCFTAVGEKLRDRSLGKVR